VIPAWPERARENIERGEWVPYEGEIWPPEADPRTEKTDKPSL
jgi:hypothetical protein